jgi:hypothetical protein
MEKIEDLPQMAPWLVKFTGAAQNSSSLRLVIRQKKGEYFPASVIFLLQTSLGKMRPA